MGGSYRHRVPLWRGDHVAIKQRVEDYAQFLYLPRLRTPAVLIGAVQAGLPLTTFTKDSFAYAEGYDDEKRYRGLRVTQLPPLSGDDPQGLLVKPEAALQQQEREHIVQQPVASVGATTTGSGEVSPTTNEPSVATGEAAIVLPNRFHGTVPLDATRVGRDAAKVAEEVIAHLASLVGSHVTVSLEISTEIPNGIPDQIIRIVTENCRTLKFTNQGFERE